MHIAVATAGVFTCEVG